MREYRMRKSLLGLLLLALLPAGNVHALAPARDPQADQGLTIERDARSLVRGSDAQGDRGVLVDHFASVRTSEAWEDGSEGRLFVRIAWPAVDYTVHIHWIGILYDDAGNVLINGRDYDIEWEDHPTELQPFVEEFRLRGLRRARLRFVHPNTACMDHFEDCVHSVVLHVRWRGYGPVATVDDRDPVTGVGSVSYRRAARVRGEFTVDGMRVPGGDIDLGTGDLFRSRYFGP
jgi:hypothetical protein